MRQTRIAPNLSRRLGRSLMLCSAIALVSACGDDGAPDDSDTVDEAAAVTGEVLDGSISDAMLPLDELRSRAPQAEIRPEPSGAAEIGAEAGVADGETGAEGETDPALDQPSGTAVPAPAAGEDAGQ